MKQQSFKPGLSKYVPLIVIFTLIVALTWIKSYFNAEAALMAVMADFMAFFFLIFGAFKVINLSGFVKAYQMYDLLAKKSRLYAYLYPFLEVGLGVAYLARFELFWVNWVTLIVMLVSALGVARELAKGHKIVCACLGAVFLIPMTKVTLLEDLLMAVMAAVMLWIM